MKLANKLADWTGAAALIVAPFFINYNSGKVLAIIGLLLLSVQAYRLKANNLLMLNFVGVLGYLWSIYYASY